MAKAVKSEMQLAPQGTAGGNIYNLYHLLGQLAAIYLRAAQLDHHEVTRTQWDAIAVEIVEDLGRLHGVWHSIQHDYEGTCHSVDEEKLTVSITRLCGWAESLVLLLDTWTLLGRWSRPLVSIEKRLQVVLKRLEDLDVVHSADFIHLAESSRRRLMVLQVLGKYYEAERRELSQAARGARLQKAG